jgi:hypothetical protein
MYAQPDVPHMRPDVWAAAEHLLHGVGWVCVDADHGQHWAAVCRILNRRRYPTTGCGVSNPKTRHSNGLGAPEQSPRPVKQRLPIAVIPELIRITRS